MGYHDGQDPYLVHQVRVDLDGKNFTLLTEGDGTDQLQWSPDEKYFVDKYSRVDLPPVHQLRNGGDGSLICLLEEADASEILDSGRRFPEPFVAAGRDGQTPIHGIIHRPINFDPTSSYPVVEYIYAGPHGHHVPKDFRAHYRLEDFIDRGFIVVQIDGMGTSWRSKAFHDVCWQNLVDGGFPDRVAWIKAAARHEPAMDVSRVGIFGGSAGGQNALAAVLTHGDFYQAAMADCGCHDNRMDKIWWNEQWMGYPLGDHYRTNSNVTLAPQLEGNLLLIVGELDRNVDPASTMQVVDALVKADKDFEMLVIPGAGHGASGTPYGRRRTAEFFVRHLKP
jgi:dipeptidyl aminopeptidase/acylaminoacyl peptidase